MSKNGKNKTEQLNMSLDKARNFKSRQPRMKILSYFDDVLIEDTIPVDNDFVDSILAHGVRESVTVGIWADGKKILINGRRRVAAEREAQQRFIDAIDSGKYKDTPHPWTKRQIADRRIPVIEIEDVTLTLVKQLQSELNSKRGENIISDINSLTYFIDDALALGAKNEAQAIKHGARAAGINMARAQKLCKIGQLDVKFIAAIADKKITENNAAKIANLPDNLQNELLQTLEESGRITATHIKQAKTVKLQELDVNLPKMEHSGKVDAEYIPFPKALLAAKNADFGLLVPDGADLAGWLISMEEFLQPYKNDLEAFLPIKTFLTPIILAAELDVSTHNNTKD